MNVETGDLYPSYEKAIEAGVAPEKLVEVKGPKRAIQTLQRAARLNSKTVKRARAARKKAQKLARKRNRGV